ncbi:hypothetical protein QBC41DRAFT_337651 [Cercophora samala]|uniref:Uncharacterized protein n=1 Tax=Cercophora samala TaxID=330535 RepID=A0AA39ZCX0_9PEZI|nr:hypothetical protein QBC41DRAFT_337651 [Cercophora samala]
MCSRFKDDQRGEPLFIVRFRRPNHYNVFVHGFGIPFANGNDAELEAWVNHHGALAEAPGVSLMSFLQQKEFCLVVVHRLRDMLLEDLKQAHVSHSGPGYRLNYFQSPTTSSLTYGQIHGPTPGNPSLNNRQLTGSEIKDCMQLCRSMWHGAGFWNWMTSPAPQQSGPVTVRPLPRVNLLAGLDHEFRDALLSQGPEDKQRLGNYLSDRPLSIGIITTPSGDIKTTLLAVAGTAMRRTFGPVLSLAPVHTAVDKLAQHLYIVDNAACGRFNEEKTVSDKTRARRLLVVRAFRTSLDWSRMLLILHNPDKPWEEMGKRRSKWRLSLTPVFWLLRVMGSRRFGLLPLDPDDSQFLLDLQLAVFAQEDLRPIRHVLARKMAFSDVPKRVRQTSLIALKRLLAKIRENADILCMTPSLSGKGDELYGYRRWKKRAACAYLVDEADHMMRRDFLDITGNVIIPLVMGGDGTQACPTEVVGSDDSRHERMDLDKVSALDFLKATGMPVYRGGR